MPSALVRRLGHQPPRPSPSRSRDTESDGSGEWETTDSDSDGSYSSSRSSNQEVGRSRKKRLRMRMYADEEEEKSKKRNLLKRLSTTPEEKNGQSNKMRPSRPVHTRLGPSIDHIPLNAGLNSTSTDLRKRLGSSGSKNVAGTALLPNEDEEQTAFDSVNIDLRSKLQSRLGSK